MEQPSQGAVLRHEVNPPPQRSCPWRSRKGRKEESGPRLCAQPACPGLQPARACGPGPGDAGATQMVDLSLDIHSLSRPTFPPGQVQGRDAVMRPSWETVRP